MLGRPRICQNAPVQDRSGTAVRGEIILDRCIGRLYTDVVIKSFRHKGIERFFTTGSKSGIQPKHADKLRRQLFALDNSRMAEDMNAPGWRLHQLRGELDGHWSIDVSGNWRLTFAFEGEDAVLVDYQDYH